MTNKIGQLMVSVIGAILLVYSASRSLHFIALTLPADKQILAWAGLLALDGGMIAWMVSYMRGSMGAWQRTIALIMVVIDFLGAVVIFTMDTVYVTGEAGLTAAISEQAIQTSVLALSIVIALNIGAAIAHHMLDPENLRRQAEETARAEIEDQALALIQQNSKQLAAEVAPQVANAWRDGIVTEYGHRLKKPRQARLPALAPDGESELPSNDELLANPTSRRSSKRS